MSDVRYARLTLDVFDDEKIDSILSHENGDAIFLVWFQLFLKVKKKGTEIYTTFSDVDTPIQEILSIILHEPKELIKIAIEKLVSLEMLEIKNNEVKVIVPWLSNQYYRTTPEYISWRTQVFKRDNFTCQHCKSIGNKLNAHHIKSFAEHKSIRYEVSNGITLCELCHRAEHKRMKQGDEYVRCVSNE